MEREEWRRAQIFRAVASVVAEEGIAGASMRKIARRAQVSTGMLMHYFANKREMILATRDAATRHLEARGEELEPAPADGNYLAKIETAVFEHAFSQRDDETPPWSFWLEFWAQAARDTEFRAYHEEQFETARTALARMLERAIAAGEVRSDIEPMAAAEALIALYNGLGVSVALADGGFTPQRAHEVAVMFLTLLGNPQPAAPIEPK